MLAKLNCPLGYPCHSIYFIPCVCVVCRSHSVEKEDDDDDHVQKG